MATAVATLVKNTKKQGLRPMGILLYGPSKSGKAQPIDTPVLTPNGFVPIGELSVGDAVIGGAGKPVEVKGVFPRGKREVYAARFEDGAETCCCLEHLWLTRQSWEEEARVRPFGELLERGLKGNESGGYQRRRWYMPVVAPVEFAPLQKLPIDAYAMGLLLGDGGFTKTTPTFHKEESDLLEKLRPALLSIDVEMQHVQEGTWSLRGGPRGVTRSNPLTTILRQLGLMGLHTIDKFVPEAYLFASVEDRLELLRGLVDTDGDVSKGGVSITANTSSPRLRDAIVWLTRSLGGVTRVASRHPKYTHNEEQRIGQEAYRINLRLPDEFCPVSSKKHLARLRKPESFTCRHPPCHALDDAVLVGTEECVCIKVDGDLYVTEDFLVTHNSSFAGTFPNPVFIVPRQERGTTSLEGDHVARPEGFDYIEAGDTREFRDACNYVRLNWEKHGWKTVVVDPLTTFGKIFQLELNESYSGKDPRGMWAILQQVVLNGWNLLQACPLHSVWICHTDDRKSGDLLIEEEPLLVGKSLGTIEANADLILYMEAFQTDERGPDGKSTGNTVTERGFYTKCPPGGSRGRHVNFKAGGRWEAELKEGYYKPHYSVFQKRLQGKVAL